MANEYQDGSGGDLVRASGLHGWRRQGRRPCRGCDNQVCRRIGAGPHTGRVHKDPLGNVEPVRGTDLGQQMKRHRRRDPHGYADALLGVNLILCCRLLPL